MAVRRSILGIDGPGPLAAGLRDAQYIADEGLSTAAYLTLALGKPLLLEGAPASARPRPPRRWPPCWAAN